MHQADKKEDHREYVKSEGGDKQIKQISRNYVHAELEVELGQDRVMYQFDARKCVSAEKLTATGRLNSLYEGMG